MFFSSKKSYTMALSKDLNVSGMNCAQIVDSLVYAQENELESKNLRPVLFAAVYTDGYGILWNESADEPPVMRCQIPFSPIIESTRTRLQERDLQLDIVFGAAMALEQYAQNVEFSGHTLLAGTLDVLVSEVGLVYTDSEDPDTVIIPITVFIDPDRGQTVSVEDSRVEFVLVEDLTEFYQRVGMENMEELSVDFLKDIVTGLIEFPEEPEGRF